MIHFRNEGRWSAVPAIGGLVAALLLLSSCGREATSPAAPELAVLSQSVLSGKDKGSDNKVALSVALEGNGNGMVKSSPKGIACGGKAEHDDDHGDKGKGDEKGENCKESFAPGTVVTLTAKAIGHSDFAGWTEGPCAGTAAPTCTFTLSAATSVKAKFSRGVVVYYTLTVTTTGIGTVTASPAGIANCGANCASYEAGTVVTLTATSDPAVSTFASWSGDCTGTSSPCTLTVNGNKTVGADFTAVGGGNLSLTVLLVGNGTVDEATPGNSCWSGDTSFCPWSFPTGATVTLNATPDANNTFSGWSVQSCTAGGPGSPPVCVPLTIASCSSASTCVLSMTQAYTVTATFVLNGPVGVAVANSGLDGKTVGSAFLSDIRIGTVAIDHATTQSAIIEQQQ